MFLLMQYAFFAIRNFLDWYLVIVELNVLNSSQTSKNSNKTFRVVGYAIRIFAILNFLTWYLE